MVQKNGYNFHYPRLLRVIIWGRRGIYGERDWGYGSLGRRREEIRERMGGKGENER